MLLNVSCVTEEWYDLGGLGACQDPEESNESCCCVFKELVLHVLNLQAGYLAGARRAVGQCVSRRVQVSAYLRGVREATGTRHEGNHCSGSCQATTPEGHTLCLGHPSGDAGMAVFFVFCDMSRFPSMMLVLASSIILPDTLLPQRAADSEASADGPGAIRCIP